MKYEVWEKTQSVEYGGWNLGSISGSISYNAPTDLLSYQQGAILGARLGFSFAGPVAAVSGAATGMLLAHFIN